MKKLSVFIVLLLFSCNYFYNHIEISGSVPNVNDGDILIKDLAAKVVFGSPVRSGKFHITKQALKTSGYYTLFIPNSLDSFEIYLEPGKYQIDAKRTKSNAYPNIVSSSKIQNELTAYYTLADSLFFLVREEERKLINQMNSKAVVLMPDQQYDTLIEQVKVAQVKNSEASITAIDQYLNRFPNSEVVAHLISNMNYENNPVKFYKLYQKFSSNAKNSKEGVEIGKLLSVLVKLQVGALAPAIIGKTPDNKMINVKSLNKKLIIIDFWRASLMSSRKNHQDFVNNLMPNFQDKGVGIISVSLDTKADWWTTAIKDDKMTWPQVSDLQGFDSPNVTNWGIKTIPLYYILDGSGRIIERGIQHPQIQATIQHYLNNQQ
ncbi:MAG: DUF4369 domain-containing protein [Sphingobacteriaceae bacterium]|nr:MAG: DUF4369 domain-containing protein [Sphingobacteriaceae bacterium]